MKRTLLATSITVALATVSGTASATTGLFGNTYKTYVSYTQNTYVNKTFNDYHVNLDNTLAESNKSRLDSISGERSIEELNSHVNRQEGAFSAGIRDNKNNLNNHISTQSALDSAQNETIKSNTDRSLGNQKAIETLQTADKGLSEAIQQEQKARENVGGIANEANARSKVNEERSIATQGAAQTANDRATYLEARADTVEGNIRETNTQVEADRVASVSRDNVLNDRVNGTNDRIDGTNVRIDDTNGRIDQTNRDVVTTNERIDRTNVGVIQANDRINGTNVRINETNVRIDETNGRINQTNSNVTSNKERLNGHDNDINGLRKDTDYNTKTIVKNHEYSKETRTSLNTLYNNVDVVRTNVTTNTQGIKDVNTRVDNTNEVVRSQNKVLQNHEGRIATNEQNIEGLYNWANDMNAYQHNVNANHEQRLSQAEHRISGLEDDVRNLKSGVAGVAALTGIQFDPGYDGVQAGIGTGVYDSGSALAAAVGGKVGEDGFLNFGASVPNRGSSVFNAGYTHRF